MNIEFAYERSDRKSCHYKYICNNNIVIFGIIDFCSNTKLSKSTRNILTRCSIYIASLVMMSFTIHSCKYIQQPSWRALQWNSCIIHVWPRRMFVNDVHQSMNSFPSHVALSSHVCKVKYKHFLERNIKYQPVYFQAKRISVMLCMRIQKLGHKYMNCSKMKIFVIFQTIHVTKQNSAI